MARTRPADRLDALLAAAAAVFTERGYRRTQMADVAREMGVAPGTLYLYVESKEALFDLVVQRAFVGEREAPPPSLPVPTPAPGATLNHLRRRAAREGVSPLLDAALRRTRTSDAEGELRGVARELYTSLWHQRRVIRLIQRSALDWPDLAGVWFGEIRRDRIDKLTRYLTRRVKQKRLRAVPTIAATARLVLELVAWSALHRYGDPQPPRVDDSEMEDSVVDFIVNALTRRTK